MKMTPTVFCATYPHSTGQIQLLGCGDAKFYEECMEANFKQMLCQTWLLVNAIFLFVKCVISFNFLDIHSYILHKLCSLWKNVDQIELVTWTQQGFQASARAQFLKKLSKLSKSETRERVSDLSQIYLRRTGAAASSVLPAFCWLALQLFFATNWDSDKKVFVQMLHFWWRK